MRYGIFGGTFDPFTPAHYEIVNKVLEGKLVDKVIVLPTIVDYYRTDKTRIFTYEERLAIIKKWFEGNDNIIVDDFEYEYVKDDPERSKCRRYYGMLHDAIIRYNFKDSDRYGDNSYATIIGGDSWNDLASWYAFRLLGKDTEFIVANRDNCKLANWAEIYDEYENQPLHVFSIPDRIADISASQYREHLEVVCRWMNMGPNEPPFDAYLDEIDDYKKSKMTYVDREKEFVDVHQKLINQFRKEKCSQIQLQPSCDATVLAHTKIFDVVEGPEVEAGFRPVKVLAPDWVTIVAEKDGKFLRETQFRFGLQRTCEEFPCGMAEPGETPEEAAARELTEETGIVVDQHDLVFIGSCAANPAFMTNRMHYFYVDLSTVGFSEQEKKLDEHEKLTTYWQDKSVAVKSIGDDQYASVFAVACVGLLREKNII